MSKELKFSLLALLALPIFAVWFFWEHPTADRAVENEPARRLELVRDAAPGVLTTPATNVVAVSGSEAPVALPSPGSSTDADGEARTRFFLHHRPSFLKGTPLGCDPPYTIDADGTKRYKKECF